MTGHDPLCPRYGLAPFDRKYDSCRCDLIARVRADERDNVWGVARIKAEARAAVSEEIAQAIEAERDHFMRVTYTPANHPLVGAFNDAAAIARRIGGTP
jgi:hypothetical protein